MLAVGRDLQREPVERNELMRASPEGVVAPDVASLEFQGRHENVSPRGMFDDVEPKRSRRFLTAAVVAFSGRGYHATTTRDIAAIAGTSPAAMYTYYATKADLFCDIALIGHRHILQELEDAVASGAGPSETLADIVRRSVMYHAEEHVVARVVNTDLRALDAVRLAPVMKIRRAISSLVRAQVQRGTDAGDFNVEHIDGAVIAILRLVDVAPWYNERGSMTPAELAEVYVGLVLRMLGTSPGKSD